MCNKYSFFNGWHCSSPVYQYIFAESYRSAAIVWYMLFSKIISFNSEFCVHIPFNSKILLLDIIIIKQQFNTTTLMSLFIYCSTEVCGKFLQLFSNFFFKMIKLQYMNHVSLLTLIILFLRNLYPSIIIHQYRYIQSNFKERKKTYSVSWYKLTMRISIVYHTLKQLCDY